MADEIAGRYVCSETETGNAILREAKRTGSFQLFSSALKTAAVLRKKEERKKKLNAVDRQQLSLLYEGVSAFARCDQKLFREVVPEREIVAWFDHVASVLQQKINDSHWIKTGDLLEHDAIMLRSYSVLLIHAVPAVMTYENTKNLEIISSMIISRKGASNKLPQEDFSQSVCLIIWFLVRNGVLDFDNVWTPEKVWKKLEASGIVEQFLRCATLPTSVEKLHKVKTVILVTLVSSTAFVKKRLKEGTPCGNTVRALVAKAKGDDPTAICGYTLRCLQSIVKLSTLLQIQDPSWCLRCKRGSPTEEYMRCGRCKQVRYCSKECQRADWKDHKMHCVEARKRNDLPVLSRLAMMNIVKELYLEIMIRLVQECDKAGGLKMKDMVLELDLGPDKSGGIALFVQDPLQIKITPLSRYLDGSRLEELLEPGCGRPVLDGSPDEFVSRLIHQLSMREELEIENLFSFEMHPQNWSFSVQQVFIMHSNRNALTQEAVDAFRAALVDGDYSGLFAVFENPEIVRTQKAQIDALRDAGRLR